MNLILLWLILVTLFFFVPLAYYAYLKTVSSRPWGLNIDPGHRPNISILIPTHNEEKIIKNKLSNITRLEYPKEKIQIIVTDDASTDDTPIIVNEFIENNKNMDIILINNSHKMGKSEALNEGLEHAKHDFIVMTDADTFLSKDILERSTPYMGDPRVGALTARQKILNSEASFSTKLEERYMDSVYTVIRVGQSKIYSSIITHGSYVLYNRRYLDQFNVESDDTGTSLDIIQKGGRVIHVPEAVSYALAPISPMNRAVIKLRRAFHNIHTLKKTLGLYLGKRLMLPPVIVLPEAYLYLVNPVVFIALGFTSLLVVFLYYPWSLSLILLLAFMLLLKGLRMMAVDTVMSNTILFISLLSVLTGRELISWKSIRDTSSDELERLLSINDLI